MAAYWANIYVADPVVNYRVCCVCVQGGGAHEWPNTNAIQADYNLSQKDDWQFIRAIEREVCSVRNNELNGPIRLTFSVVLCSSELWTFVLSDDA